MWLCTGYGGYNFPVAAVVGVDSAAAAVTFESERPSQSFAARITQANLPSEARYRESIERGLSFDRFGVMCYIQGPAEELNGL